MKDDTTKPKNQGKAEEAKRRDERRAQALRENLKKRKEKGRGVKAIEKGTAGESSEDFLKEQGTLEETTETAIRWVLAFKRAAAIREAKVRKEQKSVLGK